MVNGKEMKLADLRADMPLKGTVVTAVPTTVVVRQTAVTGQAPKPVDAPALVEALLILEQDDIPQ
jgi:hypothetical protein